MYDMKSCRRVKKKNKILVVIDFSRQSVNAAAYISAMLHPLENFVSLLPVEDEKIDVFKDKKRKGTGCSLATAGESSVSESPIYKNLLRAEKIFLAKKFPRDNIYIVRPPLNKGTGYENLVKFLKDFDLLVTARADTGKNPVGLKMLPADPSLPLVIVSGKPDTDKILLGYDGSNLADHAVKNSVRFIRNDVDRIRLCHVIRYFNRNRWEKMEQELERTAAFFVRQGFFKPDVSLYVNNCTGDYFTALLDMAESSDCGSLVIGRRHHPGIKAFPWFGKKSGHMGGPRAVWLM